VEDPGHEGRQRRGRHEGVPAEGAVALGQQLAAPFLQAPGVVEQRASPVGTDANPMTEPSSQATPAVASTITRLEPMIPRARPPVS
jgi:hypothetical protein